MNKERLPLAFGILAAGAVAAVVLHVLAGTTFPSPWPDEIDFMTPAAQLARHFTLAAPQLSAPHGMLWEPDLMYFLWAPVLRFAPLTVESGRWVSLVMLLAAGAGFFEAGRQVGVGATRAAIVVALWLVNPLAILTGNIARPEAMVLAFIAWAAVATLRDRPYLAVSLAALASLSHSAGVPFAAVIGGANLARHRVRWPAPRRADKVVLAAAVALVGFQVFHLVSHASVALDQLRFQARVKSNVTHGNRLPYVIVAAVLSAGLLVLRRRLGWQAVLLGSLAVAGLVVLFVGWEEWYEVYALATAPLLVCFVALIGLRSLDATPLTLRVAGALAIVLFGTYVIPPTTQPQFASLQFRRHPDEWPVFVHRVRAELLAIDSSETQPTVVVLNDVSGLPWPLVGDRVGEHLRLVKETLVTRTTTHPAIALFTPGHRQPPRGTVLAHVYSPHRQFSVVFVDLLPVRF